jgi:glycosyltransferase involved in cell wall biosynthesis
MAERAYRILHAVGPGDAVDSYRNWRLGRTVISETSKTYSGEFYSFCASNGIHAWVVSSHPRAEKVTDGNLVIENRPKPGGAAARGLGYHTQLLRYALSLLRSALIYRPHLVLIDSGTLHWFMAAGFRLLGACVVPNFHNTPWPAGFPPASRAARLRMSLDAWFLRRCAGVAMGVSPECERQARQLAGRPIPFFQYRAQYDARHFGAPVFADPDTKPFRVLFVGRVERNKGVFDVLEMAATLKAVHPDSFAFDLCGSGSALAEVRKTVEARRLEDVVTVHGRLDRPELLEQYARCHMVIVPTRSNFVEGFAMVAAEAVLMGRPILSNPVVPACEVLGPAAVLARTNDVCDYVAKLKELAFDPGCYRKACQACAAAAAPFVDRSYSLEAALARTLESLRPGWRAAASPAAA